ncbi:hypothetical protein [Helicobacter sp. 23-1046]
MALFDKIFGTNNNDKSAENSERQRILEIIENGDKDKLNELGIQIHKGIKENPTNFALSLFAEVFVWKPMIVRAIYGIEETTNLCSEFQKQIEPLIERVNKRYHSWEWLEENLDFLGNDDIICKSLIFYSNRYVLLTYLYVLFAAKECKVFEAFWNVLKNQHSEDDVKRRKELYSEDIEYLINEMHLFNKDGVLKDKLSFQYLEVMVEYFELQIKFDKELATKYIQAKTAK